MEKKESKSGRGRSGKLKQHRFTGGGGGRSRVLDGEQKKKKIKDWKGQGEEGNHRIRKRIKEEMDD